MNRTHLLRHALRVGIFAIAACCTGALVAKDDDDDDRTGPRRPPQVLRQGFESSDHLLKDIERAERGPKHSAWIVESSRFLNVPHRAFQPDVGEPPFVDLPVNVGIIKAPNGDITLYDSGPSVTTCTMSGRRSPHSAVSRFLDGRPKRNSP